MAAFVSFLQSKPILSVAGATLHICSLCSFQCPPLHQWSSARRLPCPCLVRPENTDSTTVIGERRTVGFECSPRLPPLPSPLSSAGDKQWLSLGSLPVLFPSPLATMKANQKRQWEHHGTSSPESWRPNWNPREPGNGLWEVVQPETEGEEQEDSAEATPLKERESLCQQKPTAVRGQCG